MYRVLLVFLLVLLGCAKKADLPAEMAYGDMGRGYEAAESKANPNKGSGASRASPRPPSPSAAPRAQDYSREEAGTLAEPEDNASATPAAPRMVHYQGHAELRVGKVAPAIDAAVALATAAGGGIEQQYGNTVVLRVPVARFQEVFDAILAAGDVVSKTVSAEDVTDAFTATELRLQTATARRDRLVQLLALSKDENEKLALVREIQQVTEEIDRLGAQARALEGLATYSRITLQFQERPALTWQGGAPESAAFQWIRALTPFAPSLPGKKRTVPVPEGFVALDIKRQLVAESADGARIWTVRLPNDPVGDTPFWTDAVKQRLSSEFAAATPVTVGGWTGLRFVDRSDAPYTWIVLLRAEGKSLDLVQLFYPTQAAEERYAPAVQAALAAGGAA